MSRIFSNFREALGEIKRDLAEMGVRIHTATMQDKYIGDLQDFETLELQNYLYTVTSPCLEDLDMTYPWFEHEWMDRLDGIWGHPQNPGTAWEHRRDVWEEFLHDGKFSYTYSERLSLFDQVQNAINRLREDKFSRQLYIAMWTPEDSTKLGHSRVPCTLGWHLQFRQGRLNMTYFMRSCDFFTHLSNDIGLSFAMQEFIANMVGLPTGHFSHYIASLHVYQKDVSEVF